MTKKKIPYGVSNFEAIINEDYYYVDKTKYIRLLESLNERHIFFLRPRKFGKSLFISLLQYYYGIEHRDKFNRLFGNYYIGKNPTSKANSYYILKFDFSSIMTFSEEETFRGFRKKVVSGIKYFNKAYNLFSEEILASILAEETSNEIMLAFFNEFSPSEENAKIFILIDEYDHFTNELISFRMTEFQQIVSKNGYVRKFYEAIKEASGNGIVDRFFAAGVTPVTLDSLTSGFNIGKDLTLDLRFNEMLGFTDAEMKILLAYYEIENIEEVATDLQNLYNGSLFSPEASERIYNSNMLLYFLSEFLSRNKYPSDLIDSNIASDHGKIKSIFYMNNSPEHQQKLNQIITEEETTGVITKKFSFERPFTPDDFVSLLFYNGLITIKEIEYALIRFRIPNYVIKEIYWDFFKEEITRKFNININISNLQQALQDLAVNNNMGGWIKEIEKVLDLLSNRDLLNFDEKYIKMLFITLASLSPAFIIKSETEVNGEYPDLMYLFRKPNSVKFQFLLELKYLKKGDSAQLNRIMEKAEQQVKRYLLKQEIKELKNLRIYIIVFTGKQGHFKEIIPD